VVTSAITTTPVARTPTFPINYSSIQAVPVVGPQNYIFFVTGTLFVLIALRLGYVYLSNRTKTDPNSLQLTPVPSLSRTSIISLVLLAIISLTSLRLISHQQADADIIPTPDKGKYVIGYSANPPVAYLRAHIDEVRRTGLDGIILNYRQWPTNPSGCCDTSVIFRMDKTVANISQDYLDRFANEWSSFVKDTGLLPHSLQAVRLSTTTDSNITAIVTDEQLQSVYDKWRIYVKTMIKAGIEGLWFDNEQSGTLTGFFDVPPVIDGVATNTLPADQQLVIATRYEQRVKDIGQRLSEIIAEETAGKPFSVMLYFGAGFASHDYITTRQQLLSLWDGGQHAELLPAFEAGLLKGATPNIDISETDFKSNKIKPDANNTVLAKLQRTRDINPSLLQALTDEPASITNRIQVNEELWIDYNDDGKKNPHPWYWQDDSGNWYYTNRHYDDAGVLQWDVVPVAPDQVQDNYYTPDQVTTTLRDEITTTNRYAWIYLQTVDLFGWLKSLNLPQATPLGSSYLAALAAARTSSDATPACTLDITTPVTTYLTGHSYELQVAPNWPTDTTGLVTTVEASPRFQWDKDLKTAVYAPSGADSGSQSAIFVMTDGVNDSQCLLDLPTVAAKPVANITVSSDKEVLSPGDNVVFTITVTNQGNDTTKNGILEINLSSKYSLVDTPSSLAIPDQEPNQTFTFNLTATYQK